MGQVYGKWGKRNDIHSTHPVDFFIGVHAAVAQIPLLTRDVSRNRIYFPKLKLIAPGPHPNLTRK